MKNLDKCRYRRIIEVRYNLKKYYIEVIHIILYK